VWKTYCIVKETVKSWKPTFFLNSKFLQMSLAAHFQQTSSNYTIKLNRLVKDQQYPITCAKRDTTRFGPAVLLTIWESENSLKVFLPRRYSEIMTDEDLTNVNSGKEKWNLVYKDKCSQTNGHLLAITGEETDANKWMAFLFFLLHRTDYIYIYICTWLKVCITKYLVFVFYILIPDKQRWGW
jgi:hypothetical protein